MAYILGEAALRVTPNMSGFHNRIRNDKDWIKAKNEEIHVPIELDMNEFNRDLRALEERLDRIDGRVVEVKVDLDDDDLRRRLDRVYRDMHSNPMTIRMLADEDSLNNMQRVMDSFKDDNAVIKSHVLVDRFHADEEMLDFREKHNNQIIRQKLEIELPDEMPSVADAGRERDQAAYARIARKTMQREWSVISLVPDLISKMDEQVEAGIRQIYDPYLRLVGNTYNQMMRPLRGFRDMFNESKSMAEFNERIARSFDGIKEKSADAFLTIGSGMENFDIGVRKAMRNIKSFSDGMRLRMMYAGDGIKSFVLDKFDSIRLRTMFAADYFKSFGGEVKSVMRSMGADIETGFLRSVHGIRHGMDMAVERVRFFGRSLMDSLSDQTIMRLAKLRAGFIELGGGLKSMAGGWGRAIVGTVENIQRRFMATKSAVAGMAQWMSAPVLTAMYSIRDGIKTNVIGPIVDDLVGSFELLVRPMKRIFSNVGKGIQNNLLGPISNGVKSATDRVSRGMRDMMNSASNHIGRYSNMFQSNLKRVGDGITRVAGRWGGIIGDQFTHAMGRVKFGLAGLHTFMNRKSQDLILNMAIGAQRIMKPIGGMLGKAVSAGLNDTTAWRGFQRLMSRMGNYITGFTRISIGAFSKVGGAIMKTLLPALAAAAVGIGLMAGQAAIAGIMALGGAILSVAKGALLMAPALAAAAGISFAVLKIGLAEVGDAVKSAFNAETAEEFEEAIAKMPASVQEVARSFRAFKPAVDDMKRGVQDNLLGGLGPGITSSMTNLFPAISTGLQRIAMEWNGSLKQALQELSSDNARIGLENIMNKTTEAAKNMQPVLANLIAAFGSLGDQGANHLPAIGKWADEASQSFRDWADSLRIIDEGETMSRFDLAIQSAKTNLGHLSGIFGGLFGTMGNVFAAGAEGGGGMLAGMASAMQSLNAATEKGTEGYEKMVGFMHDATDAAGQLKLVIGPAFSVVMDIMSTLMRVGSGAIPGIGHALQALSTGMQPLKDIAMTFGENIGNAVAALAPAIERIGPVIAPILAALGEGLETLFVTIGPALTSIMDSLKPVADALGPIIGTVAEGLGKIFVALGPVIESSASILTSMAPALERMFFWIGEVGAKIIEVITPLMTGHDASMKRLLDNLQPIIDALGEGLLNILERIAPHMPRIAAAFDMLVMAIAAMLPYLTPVIDFFMVVLEHAVNIVADLAMVIAPVVIAFKVFSVVAGALGTVFNVLGVAIKAAGFAWKILSMLFAASPIGVIITGITLLVGALIYFFTQTEIGQELWQKFTDNLKIAWDGFVSGMEAAWAYIRDVIWAGFLQKMDEIGAAWNSFKDWLITVFNNIKTSVFDAFSAAFDYVKNFFSERIDVMKSLWQGLKDILHSVWKWIDQHVFAKMRSGLDDLKGYFSTAVDAIRDIWNKIIAATAKPAKFVVETVYGGIRTAWNGIAELIGSDSRMKEINLGKLGEYADGGVLPGYPPGRDVHRFTSRTGGAIDLSGGEAIMRPEWVKAVGGESAVHAMNKAARRGRFPQSGAPSGHQAHANGGIVGHLGAFAGGGVLAKNPNAVITTEIQRSMERAVAAAFPNQIITSGTRYVDVGSGYDNHMAGRALDFAPSGALASWIARTYPNSAELFWDPGPNLKNGNPTGAIGGHSDHVHWAMSSMVDPYTGEVVSQEGPGGSAAPSGFSIAKAMWDKAIGAIGDFPGADKLGMIGRMPGAFAKKAIDTVWDFASTKISELGGMIGGFFGGGAGGEPYRADIERAFRFQGEEPHKNLVDALVRQIDSESGGDPNIAQQIVDVNGTGPSAGLGLYQFIPGTWAGYRDPRLPDDRTNPWSAHNAAVRYFRDRHGWNTGPGGVGRGHGWKDGGLIPTDLTTLFDTGGIFKDGMLARNESGKPELVLTNWQWQVFNKAVSALPKIYDGATSALGISPIQDPRGYIEAEKKKQEELLEEEKKNLEETRKTEDEAIKERHDKELEGIDEEDEEARKKIEERHKEELDAIDERRKAEDEEHKKRVDSGSYFYGYDVYDEEGKNPNEFEASEHEKEVMKYLSALAEPLGMSGPMSKIMEKADVFRSIGSGIQTAMPAWQAAANGDYSGLNHNIAVTQAAARTQAEADFRDLGPSALSGVLQMAMSQSAVQSQQPFIGTVNTGMSRAEFHKEMAAWEARHARSGTGTVRTR